MLRAISKIILIVLIIQTNVFAQSRRTNIEGVSSNARLNQQQKLEQRNNLRGLIHKELTPIKNDYVNDFDRGTVEFNPEKGNRFGGKQSLKARNYSFNKVEIPDGTTIEGVNFTQRKPHTPAISGKNLTFIDCNLVNVEIDPTWTLISSNNAQILRVLTSQVDNGDGTTTVSISNRLEQKNQTYREESTDEEIVVNSDLANFILRFAP